MKNYYIEDIFLEFIDITQQQMISMQPHDRSAAYSFYQNIINGNSFTEAQAKYILKILYKYRNVIKPWLDYEDFIESPVWKKPFRVLDMSKKVWVEIQEGLPWIGMKFPFQFKEIFDKEFDTWSDRGTRTFWDKNIKARMMMLYDYNLVQVYDFCKTNNFEIDNSFMDSIANVEEIWNSQDYFKKYSTIEDNDVKLHNADSDSLAYFEKNKKDSIADNLMLAKRMGYFFNKKPSNIFEKIASHEGNKFWIKNIVDFINLCYKLTGKVCIILDRNSKTEDWIKNLSQVISENGFNHKDFRVCFRTNNKENPDFNKWVNENNFGGKIDTAKFLIFQQKPAKWLFKDRNDVIIVSSNDLLPTSNTTTKAMFTNHPCVIYFDEYKPVPAQKENIIEL